MKLPQRILYIDDEPHNLLAFKSTFRRSFEIDTASSAEEGISLFEEREFALVISDQRMPGMTGAEVLEIIQQRAPESIRMIMTGYSDLDAIIDAVNKGKIYYYINKPWDPDALKIILKNALTEYDLRMANKTLTSQNIQAQFEVLKNQVNPHFLFNSINVLKGLILTNQTKALEFTDRFAKLYRTMLTLGRELTIPLTEELDLINQYLFLQQTRFQDALIIQNSIRSIFLAYEIPPFALQLVVENCIKHNKISKELPLTIAIEVIDDKLKITNNIQTRTDSKDSTGIGIKNIVERYKMIKLPPPTFSQEENQWVVHLPLIKPA